MRASLTCKKVHKQQRETIIILILFTFLGSGGVVMPRKMHILFMTEKQRKFWD